MPGRTRRRAFQALVGVGTAMIGGLAGCVSDRRSPGTNGDQTTDQTTTTTTRQSTTAGTTTTAADAAPRLSLGESATVPNARGPDEEGTVAVKTVEGRRQFYLGRLRAGGQRDIRGSSDRKYLWTEFALSWSEMSTDCFMRGHDFARLVLDDDTSPIAEPCAYESNRSERGDGEAIFGVPADVTAESVWIEWLADGDPVAAWRVPDEAMAWLNDPPMFEVTGVDAPDRVTSGHEATITLSVRNVGGIDGRFRFTVDSVYSTAARFHGATVPAGETKQVRARARLSGNSTRVVIDWAYDSVEKLIAVGTTTGNESTQGAN